MTTSRVPTFPGRAATPSAFASVAAAMLGAGRVELWRRTGSDAGTHAVLAAAAVPGRPLTVLLSGPGAPGADGVLEVDLDYAGTPDRAAHHRIHDDGLGVTLCEPDGTPRATYRAVPGDAAGSVAG